MECSPHLHLILDFLMEWNHLAGLEAFTDIYLLTYTSVFSLFSFFWVWHNLIRVSLWINIFFYIFSLIHIYYFIYYSVNNSFIILWSSITCFIWIIFKLLIQWLIFCILQTAIWIIRFMLKTRTCLITDWLKTPGYSLLKRFLFRKRNTKVLEMKAKEKNSVWGDVRLQ